MPLQRIAELLVEQAKDYAIFTLDSDGLITSWSPGAVRVTGYAAEEVLGTSFSRLFTASDIAAGHDRRELATALRNGRAEDSRWHLRKDGERFWANGVTFALAEADFEGLLKIVRDETAARLAEEQRVLLLNELNHRINNTLVTVQALVDQTLRAREVRADVRDDVAARLLALAEAHKVLVDQNWAGADLAAIVSRALAPYEQQKARAEVDGPPLRLSPQQAVSMSLILHELATNAIKYGALSTPAGTVSVSWNLALDGSGGRHMTFLWLERGGPPVTAPQRKGFGTRLIERSMAQESGSRVEVGYEPDGVRCAIELSLSTSAEIPPLDIAQAAGRSPR
jgi:PAS domain S-box-containing protein